MFFLTRGGCYKTGDLILISRPSAIRASSTSFLVPGHLIRGCAHEVSKASISFSSRFDT